MKKDGLPFNNFNVFTSKLLLVSQNPFDTESLLLIYLFSNELLRIAKYDNFMWENQFLSHCTSKSWVSISNKICQHSTISQKDHWNLWILMTYNKNINNNEN